MREVVKKVLAGDKEAYREIVRECGPMIQVYLFSHVPDHHQVEDLSQEVFVAAYWALSTYDPARDFRAWLGAIARNKLMSHLRSRYSRKNSVHVHTMDIHEMVLPDLERCNPDTEAVMERMRGCIEKHPEKDRRLIHTGMKVLNEKFQKMEPYEVRVANALYGEKTYPFRAEYMDTINKFYNTGAFMPVDFKGNGEAVRLQINGWVEKQTRERIKDLLKEGTVDERTRLVLVNAIYFKGDWAVSFEAKETKAEDFLADGVKKVNVPMMRNDLLEGGRYGAFKADGTLFATPQRVSLNPKPEPAKLYPGKGGFQVAELPYKGGELSMAIIVPQDADGLAAVEKELTSAKLAAWLGQLEGRDMNVQMPKFKMETDYPAMENTLQALGMKQAFDRDLANFDGMCASGSAGLYISKVAHKAFVEVNEQGTEAAAATGAGFAYYSLPEDKPFKPTVRADRPFLFAIRDVKTGTILFVGRMVDPTGTAPQTAGK